MTRHRKHRVVVEITTNKPISERQAARALQQLLNQIDTDAQPIWPVGDVYADKLCTKQFSYIFAAETTQRKRNLTP